MSVIKNIHSKAQRGEGFFVASGYCKAQKKVKAVILLRDLCRVRNQTESHDSWNPLEKLSIHLVRIFQGLHR